MYKMKQAVYLSLILGLLPQLSFAVQTCSPLAFRTTPTERFTNNGDGTVTDKETGLMWQKCLDGASGATCETGNRIGYSWPNALQRAVTLNSSSGFANHTDWRVPNIKELMSIVEHGCTSLGINYEVFPSVYGDDWSTEWSSTPYTGSSASYPVNAAFVMKFSNGTPWPFSKRNESGLRLVRTATPTY